MRRVTKENLIIQIDRLYKIKDEQGQLSMSGEYTLQAYEMLLATMDSEPVAYIPKSQLNLLKNRVMVEADLSKVRRFDEIPLYRHAQPVPDEKSIFDAAIDACRKDDSITEHAWNHGVLAVQSHFNTYHAAMLNQK